MDMYFTERDKEWLKSQKLPLTKGIVMKWGEVFGLYNPRNARGHVFISSYSGGDPGEIFQFDSANLDAPLVPISEKVMSKTELAVLRGFLYDYLWHQDMLVRDSGIDLAKCSWAPDLVKLGVQIRSKTGHNRLSFMYFGSDKIGGDRITGAVTDGYLLGLFAEPGYFSGENPEHIFYSAAPIELFVGSRNSAKCRIGSWRDRAESATIYWLVNPKTGGGADFYLDADQFGGGYDMDNLVQALIQPFYSGVNTTPGLVFDTAPASVRGKKSGESGVCGWRIEPETRKLLFSGFLEGGYIDWGSQVTSPGELWIPAETVRCLGQADNLMVYLGKQAKPFYIRSLDGSRFYAAMPVA